MGEKSTGSFSQILVVIAISLSWMTSEMTTDHAPPPSVRNPKLAHAPVVRGLKTAFTLIGSLSALHTIYGYKPVLTPLIISKNTIRNSTSSKAVHLPDLKASVCREESKLYICSNLLNGGIQLTWTEPLLSRACCVSLSSSLCLCNSCFMAKFKVRCLTRAVPGVSGTLDSPHVFFRRYLKRRRETPPFLVHLFIHLFRTR